MSSSTPSYADWWGCPDLSDIDIALTTPVGGKRAQGDEPCIPVHAGVYLLQLLCALRCACPNNTIDPPPIPGNLHWQHAVVLANASPWFKARILRWGDASQQDSIDGAASASGSRQGAAARPERRRIELACGGPQEAADMEALLKQVRCLGAVGVQRCAY